VPAAAQPRLRIERQQGKKQQAGESYIIAGHKQVAVRSVAETLTFASGVGDCCCSAMAANRKAAGEKAAGESYNSAGHNQVAFKLWLNPLHLHQRQGLAAAQPWLQSERDNREQRTSRTMRRSETMSQVIVAADFFASALRAGACCCSATVHWCYQRAKRKKQQKNVVVGKKH
jgi:hypothetical protein